MHVRIIIQHGNREIALEENVDDVMVKSLCGEVADISGGSRALAEIFARAAAGIGLPLDTGEER